MTRGLRVLALLAAILSAVSPAGAESRFYHATDFLHDSRGALTPTAAVEAARNGEWRSGRAPSGHLDGALWLRFNAGALGDGAATVVTVGSWWVDAIETYVVGPAPGVVQHLAPLAEPGYHTPNAFRLPESLQPGAQLFVRMASETLVRPHLNTWAPEAFQRHLERQRLLAVAAFSGMAVSALLLALSAVFLRHSAAAWLAVATVGLQAYVVFDAAALPVRWLAAMHGHFAVLNPLYMLPVCFAMLGVLRTAFPCAAEFPGFNRALKAGQALLALCWATGFVVGGRWLLQFCNGAVMAVIAVLLVGFLLLIRRGDRSAFFGLLAILPLGVAGLLRSPWLLGLVPADGWEAVPTLLPIATVLFGTALLASRLWRETEERRRLRAELRCADASARRGLEKEVRRRTMEAERARLSAEKLARVKDRFMAAVSHDLRTPLATIVGVVELLDSGAEDLSEGRQRSLLRRASKYILDVIEDLTLYERLESGSQCPASNQFSLQGVAQDIEGLLGEEAEDQGIRLAISIAPDAREIVCDRRYLARILVNLTTNALAATPRGGRVGLRLELHIADGHSELAVTVADSGRGLDAGKLDALRRGDMAGYGFTVVGDLVNALRGELTIDSEPGAGTTVTVTLPVETVVADSSPRIASGVGVPRLVLFVEDVLENQMLGSAMLRSIGCEVVAVASLAEAREALKAQRFDGLLLDRQLPDGDGLAALDELRGLCRRRLYSPRCILVTADSSIEARDYALDSGFDSLLLKPYTIEQLREVLAGGAGRLPDVSPVGHRSYLDLLTPEQRVQVLRGFRATAGEVHHAIRLAIRNDDVKLALAASHRLVGSAAAADRDEIAEQARSVNEQIKRDRRLDRPGLEHLLDRLVVQSQEVVSG